MKIQRVSILSRIKGLLGDNSLTKKASLNAFVSALDYAANIIVALVITPVMVSGLGDFYYGAWQFLMRLVGYISPASGRPTQALKFTLAKEQNSTDYDLKRSYIGSTLYVLGIFLPLMVVLGGVLTWFVPDWIRTPEAFVWHVRIVSGILVYNLILTTLVEVPQSVLEGENRGYKSLGFSTVLILAGGAATWLALHLGLGIVGVGAAACVLTMARLVFYTYLAKANAPWFGIARPSKTAVKEFLKLSGWFMAWNLINKLMMAADVVVLGLLNSVESVTQYTLSKYAPETVITVVAMMVFGVLPGLGGIIGSGDLQRAARIRGEIMTFTWLVVSVLGTSILLWNRTFISMWVGADQFVGALPGLLIVVVITQFVLIRTDANVIDLTLNLKRKVILGAISVTISILAASILVHFFDLGVVGLSLGMLAGRLILSVAYPRMIGRRLQIDDAAQIKSVIRPALVTTLLFLTAASLDHLLPTQGWGSWLEWLVFALGAGLSAVISFGLAFLLGLTNNQRTNIFNRILTVLNISNS